LVAAVEVRRADEAAPAPQVSEPFADDTEVIANRMVRPPIRLQYPDPEADESVA